MKNKKTQVGQENILFQGGLAKIKTIFNHPALVYNMNLKWKP